MPQNVADIIQRRIENFVRKQKRHPDAKRLLAEGDSWFSFGHMMWWSKTLVERLNEYKTLNIVSVANPGAELQKIVKRDNRDWGIANHAPWMKNQHYDAVLFSGGGNDIVGSELVNYLEDKSTGKTGLALIKQTELDRQLDRMRKQYQALRKTIDAEVASPGGKTVPIITHGYDYAFPSGQGASLFGGLVSVGPWILPNFISKGILDFSEQAMIVNELVDQFNQLLSDLQDSQAAGIKGFHHIDLRGMLKKEDWSDELHPTAVGRDKIAAKLRADIVALLG
jgi:hypothetical protein